LAWRLEPLHLSFPAPGRSMGILRAIIQVTALTVLDIRQDLAFRYAVAFQLVGDEYAGAYCRPFKSRLKKRFAAPALRRLWTRISSTMPS
jgi:hypothetical protein